ncbi:MAG: T9SS type A sorting domain-containing protein [Saprospiraceae bacterium]|nr:T9SS type A sorting domain-containing protein [Saprospiraceae bacterium]
MVLSQTSPNVANAYYLIEDCTFNGNSATGNYSDGGAIFAILRGLNMTMEILGCTFSGNQAPDMGEGTVGLWGTNNGTGSFLVDSCLFENNSSFLGAAIQCGNAWNGGSSVSRTIKNTRFIGNMAAKGGAIDLYNNENSPMDILIEDCLFDGNAATFGGGAVSFSPGSNGFQLFLNRCEILNNESPVGGAIEGYNFGGAILPDANIRIENCLIVENSSETSAIHLDSVSYTQIINSTIANNYSDGIQAVDKSAVFLQNTILANPGYVEYTASTNSNFTTNGGNLVLDSSLTVQLGAGDKQGLDPLFIGSGDYHLTANSPCVDTGNPDGVTATTDLAGAPRIQGERVDMGAFESPFFMVSAAREVSAVEVAVSPNPAGSFLNIRLPEAGIGMLDVQIFDAQGRLLRNERLGIGQPLDVKGLVPEMYSLEVVVGERVCAGKFIKQ